MKVTYSNNGLKIYGNHKNLPFLIKAVDMILEGNLSEGQTRIQLQNAMEFTNCPVTMLYQGNGVYPFTKTIRDFKRIVKANCTFKMTKHLYQFFNLCTGTIAHYNLAGWACVYPNNMALRELWRMNEYGYPVIDYIPHWKTDTKRIVIEMWNILQEAPR